MVHLSPLFLEAAAAAVPQSPAGSGALALVLTAIVSIVGAALPAWVAVRKASADAQERAAEAATKAKAEADERAAKASAEHERREEERRAETKAREDNLRAESDRRDRERDAREAQLIAIIERSAESTAQVAVILDAVKDHLTADRTTQERIARSLAVVITRLGVADDARQSDEPPAPPPIPSGKTLTTKRARMNSGLELVPSDQPPPQPSRTPAPQRSPLPPPGRAAVNPNPPIPREE